MGAQNSLTGGDRRIEQIGHQPERSEAARLDAAQARGQSDGFPPLATSGGGRHLGVHDLAGHLSQPTAVGQASYALELHLGRHFDDEFAPFVGQVPYQIEGVQAGIQQE